MDITYSMDWWFEDIKKKIISIIGSQSSQRFNVTACFVGYSDIKMQPRFIEHPFTKSTKTLKSWLNRKIQSAIGSNDTPEDFAGALNKMLEMKWSEKSIKHVFHFCDAPGHGREYHDYENFDHYPEGDPNGLIIERLLSDFMKRKMGYTLVKMNDTLDKQI